LDNQKLLTLRQIIQNIRAFPTMEIKLSLVILFTTLHVPNLSRGILESFANHKCFTCLDLTLSSLSESSQMEALISILKNSKSLSQLNLTFDTNNFRSPQELLRSLKVLKSVKNLKVCFTKGSTFSSNKLKEIALALTENTQIKNLEVIFERNSHDISKLQWWLFVRSLRNCPDFEKVHTKFVDRLKIISMGEFLFLFVIMSFALLICIAYALGMQPPLITVLIAILILYSTVLSISIFT